MRSLSEKKDCVKRKIAWQMDISPHAVFTVFVRAQEC